MSQSSLAHDIGYTWNNYRSWPSEERWELIGGEAYGMSPAPGTRHQGIALELGKRLSLHFEGKSCTPFIAPVDVRLSESDVVQPDLFVVCEPDKVKPTYIDGAPTLVIEILSPSTEVKDRGVKMDLYARAGVSEVWIVTPFPSLIEVYSLMELGYRLVKAYSKEQELQSEVFNDLRLPLADIFDFPLEPGEEPPVVKEPPTGYVAP
jgi:Uma2 family endonuclease